MKESNTFSRHIVYGKPKLPFIACRVIALAFLLAYYSIVPVRAQAPQWIMSQAGSTAPVLFNYYNPTWETDDPHYINRIVP